MLASRCRIRSPAAHRFPVDLALFRPIPASLFANACCGKDLDHPFRLSANARSHCTIPQPPTTENDAVDSSCSDDASDQFDDGQRPAWSTSRCGDPWATHVVQPETLSVRWQFPPVTRWCLLEGINDHLLFISVQLLWLYCTAIRSVYGASCRNEDANSCNEAGNGSSGR